MREDLTYLIIDSESITDVQVANSCQPNIKHLRSSIDLSKTLIKVEGALHSCYNGITTYTYAEILEVLKTDVWQAPLPDGID